MPKIPKYHQKFMPADLRLASEADQLEWYECFKKQRSQYNTARYHKKKEKDPALKEKRRAYAQEYYRKNRAKVLEKMREVYHEKVKADPEKMEKRRAYQREYRRKNRDKVNAYMREYRKQTSDARWVEALQAKADAQPES